MPDTSSADVHETVLQRRDKKTSSLAMTIGAVSFSFFAGMCLEAGIYHWLRAYADYHWMSDFALSFTFVVLAFRWALPLLARARSGFGG